MDIREATKNVMDASAVFAGILSTFPQQQMTLPFSARPFVSKTGGYILVSPQFPELTGEGYSIESMASGQLILDQQTRIALLTYRGSLARLAELENEFERLATMWKSERRASSSSTGLSMHPAYQRIIGMGEKVLPFIFADLQREPDHWFWALRAITDENPVPSESRGNVQEMANAWLDWGRKKGYVS